MNRQIKFRAWDEQAKTMHNDFQCIKSGDLNKGGSDWLIPLEPITNPSWIDRLEEHCKQAPHFRDQFKLMQFTGLQDSQGKDIYEGDILKITSDITFEIMEVKYFMGNACACFKGDETGTPIFPTFVTMSKEIIGNIHEHPELIEDRSDATLTSRKEE